MNTCGATCREREHLWVSTSDARPQWDPHGERKCVRTFRGNKQPQTPAATPAYFSPCRCRAAVPWGRGEGRSHLPVGASPLPAPGERARAWPAGPVGLAGTAPGLARPIALEGEAFEQESRVSVAPVISTTSEKRDERHLSVSGW